MAEILLSLTIIGVVAAITLPSLTGNINERTWNTQRKALYARFSQAIALMPALNGYGTLVEGNDSTSAVDTAAETFVTDGLSKVLKINNICDSEHLADCGIASKFTTAAGSIISVPKTLVELNPYFDFSRSENGYDWTYSQTDTKAAAFETQNGESIIAYYNPACSANNKFEETPPAVGVYWIRTQPFMCANFVYDLNGNKGPNTVGKDIGFMSVLFATDSVVVAPNPTNAIYKSTDFYGALKFCRESDENTRLPNVYEAASMFYNYRLHPTGVFITSTSVPDRPNQIYRFHAGLGYAQAYLKDAAIDDVYCVKR